jgi:hypothetical protein
MTTKKRLDAVYLERVCNESEIVHGPDYESLRIFASTLKDKDKVGVVGCGQNLKTFELLETLCTKDVQIVGIDPASVAINSPYSPLKIISKTFQDYLGVSNVKGYGNIQNIILHSAKENIRVIGMYGCACESNQDSKPLVFQDLKGRPSKYVDDIKLFLESNNYKIWLVKNNKFAFVAERR